MLAGCAFNHNLTWHASPNPGQISRKSNNQGYFRLDNGLSFPLLPAIAYDLILLVSLGGSDV